jgi:hypothetical protein
MAKRDVRSSEHNYHPGMSGGGEAAWYWRAEFRAKSLYDLHSGRTRRYRSRQARGNVIQTGGSFSTEAQRVPGQEFSVICG